MSASSYGGADRHADLAGLGSDDHLQYGMNLSGTLANRPAAGRSGRIYVATDNGLAYFDNGAAWITAVVVPATPAGTLLAVKSYSANATYAITATALAVVDGVNLVTPAFTVPASGQYLVRMTGLINIGAVANAWMRWRPMVGGVAVGANDAQVVLGNATVAMQPRATATFLVTGRTPGNSEAVQWGAYASAAAGLAANMYAGPGGNGDLTIEVLGV